MDTEIQGVVDALVARMEAGELPWHKPWKGGSVMPVNATTGREYTGIFNPLILMMKSEAYGGDTRWAGLSQWAKAKSPVKKGEGGTAIYFPNFVCQTCGAPGAPWLKSCSNGHDLTVKNGRAMAGFQKAIVFNNQQTSKPIPAVEVPQVDPSVGFLLAAQTIERCGSKIKHEGDKAFYSKREDIITLPPAGAFDNIAHYWATSLHEHMHWTGHSSRLNREGISGIFSSDAYAFEELVAEMGAAFLCMRLGVKHDSLMDNHAAYLQSWVKGLRDDPKALMKAASLANKGMQYILKADASASE